MNSTFKDILLYLLTIKSRVSDFSIIYIFWGGHINKNTSVSKLHAWA